MNQRVYLTSISTPNTRLMQQVIRYVQLAAGDVDTEMLQDAARQQNAKA
jgi:hypothetical protein